MTYYRNEHLRYGLEINIVRDDDKKKNKIKQNRKRF